MKLQSPAHDAIKPLTDTETAGDVVTCLKKSPPSPVTIIPPFHEVSIRESNLLPPLSKTRLESLYPIVSMSPPKTPKPILIHI